MKIPKQKPKGNPKARREYTTVWDQKTLKNSNTQTWFCKICLISREPVWKYFSKLVVSRRSLRRGGKMPNRKIFPSLRPSLWLFQILSFHTAPTDMYSPAFKAAKQNLVQIASITCTGWTTNLWTIIKWCWSKTNDGISKEA